MMNLRRVCAVILALIFILVFMATLVVFRINNTVLNANFYTAQLRQADTYNFLYDEVLPAAVDEYLPDQDNTGIKVTSLKPYLPSVVEQTLPRQWVQTQVETAIHSVAPYVLGDTDSFRVQIPLKERVEAAASAIKSTLSQESVSSDLYTQIINLMVDKDLFSFDGLSLTEAQSRNLYQSMITQQWLLTQADGAIDSVTPYLTGGQEHFTITVDLKSRLDDGEKAFNEILKDQAMYTYFLDNVMVPIIKQKIQSFDLSSLGITLTDDEIAGITKEIFPLEWYQSQVPGLTSQVIDYLKGNQSTLEITLSLSDRKPAAVTALSNYLNTQAGSDISAVTLPFINQFVEQLMPDQYVLDESVLAETDLADTLSLARESISQGITYTDADLLTAMGSDDQQLENIRQKISQGLVFTDQDLGTLMNTSEKTQFNNFRHEVGVLRRWLWVIWLVPVLLLVAIGALGARRWPYKLVWGASALAAASLITFILVGPLFSSVVQPRIAGALAEAVGQTQGLQALIAGKAAALAQSAVNSIVSGLQLQALILLIVSILVIVFGCVWVKTRGKTTAGG